MATRNLPASGRPPVNDDVALEEDESFIADGDIYNELQNLYDEFKNEDNLSIRIYSQPDGNQKKQDYLFAFTPGDLSPTELMDKVRDEYGGGVYRLRGYVGNKILFNKSFSVRESRLAKMPVIGHSPDSSVTPLIEFMRQQNAENQALLRTMMSSKSGNTDVIALITAMTPLLVPVVSKLLERNERNLVGELEQLAALRDIFDGGNQDRTDMDSIADIVKNFAPSFLQAINNSQELDVKRLELTLGANGRRQYTPNSQSQNISPKPNPATSQQTEGKNMNAIIQAVVTQKMQMLLKAAKNDSDPQAYAVVLLDEIPDEYFEKFCAIISDPQCLEKLSQQIPEIENHMEWFVEFRDAMLADINGDANDTDDETGTGDSKPDGNLTNASTEADTQGDES